jgi:thioesterase domain-containing protein
MKLEIGKLPTASQLQAFLEHHIPMTIHMGLEVAHLERRTIRISAPLAPNVNDKSTAFGGSLSSLLTLAGWGLLMCNLCAEGIAADVMIHKCELLYNQPVTGDFSAYCDLPDPATWERFLSALEARGRSRVIVSSWIAAERNAAVTMEGRYAVICK